MKCIYCNEETELTVSDIIPFALTGAKVKRQFVCKKHNNFTNQHYESKTIAQLDFFRNRLGLTERDGDPVRYHAELNIGEYTIPNADISDHTSILGKHKRFFKTKDKNGRKILIGDRNELLKIKGATNDKIKDVSTTDVSVVSRVNLQTLFISSPVLHTVAKIAYEWHCFINDIETFEEEKYKDIVSYILSPENNNHPVEIVVDDNTWSLMDKFSQTGSNMLFEYRDIDGNTYVIFGFWGVIIYKIKICTNGNEQLTDVNCYNSYFYHVDGTNSGTMFAVYGIPHIISENCSDALSRLCEEIKVRLQSFGERDISKEYVLKNINKIQELLPKYKLGKCTIAELLDFEHEDRVIPLYIIEQLLYNREKYSTSKSFTENMQEILDCKDKFIFTNDRIKSVLKRYMDMDQDGTFSNMIEKAISFFESL